VKLLAARKRHGGNETKCNVTLLFEDEGNQIRRACWYEGDHRDVKRIQNRDCLRELIGYLDIFCEIES
jgi:hypothetical protein